MAANKSKTVHPTDAEVLLMREDFRNTEEACQNTESNQPFIDFFVRYAKFMIYHIGCRNSTFLLAAHTPSDFLFPKAKLYHGYDRFRKVLKDWFGFSDTSDRAAFLAMVKLIYGEGEEDGYASIDCRCQSIIPGVVMRGKVSEAAWEQLAECTGERKRLVSASAICGGKYEVGGRSYTVKYGSEVVRDLQTVLAGNRADSPELHVLLSLEDSGDLDFVGGKPTWREYEMNFVAGAGGSGTLRAFVRELLEEVGGFGTDQAEQLLRQSRSELGAVHFHSGLDNDHAELGPYGMACLAVLLMRKGAFWFLLEVFKSTVCQVMVTEVGLGLGSVAAVLESMGGDLPAARAATRSIEAGALGVPPSGPAPVPARGHTPTRTYCRVGLWNVEKKQAPVAMWPKLEIKLSKKCNLLAKIGGCSQTARYFPKTPLVANDTLSGTSLLARGQTYVCGSVHPSPARALDATVTDILDNYLDMEILPPAAAAAAAAGSSRNSRLGGVDDISSVFSTLSLGRNDAGNVGKKERVDTFLTYPDDDDVGNGFPDVAPEGHWHESAGARPRYERFLRSVATRSRTERDGRFYEWVVHFVLGHENLDGGELHQLLEVRAYCTNLAGSPLESKKKAAKNQPDTAAASASSGSGGKSWGPSGGGSGSVSAATGAGGGAVDKVLVCRESRCRKEFVFSAKDQAFHRSKGYADRVRCKPCSEAQKAKKAKKEIQVRAG